MRRMILWGKGLGQRLFITLEFFHANGLANHAAAGAFGFLLSAAPVLLLASVFLLAAFRSSPREILDLVKNIPLMNVVFDEEWLGGDLSFLLRPEIPGIVSVVSIVWAGRVFALSMQRSLKIIFTGPKKPNPVRDNLVVILVEVLVLFFALAMIFSSQTALHLYDIFNFLPRKIFFLAVSGIKLRVLPVIVLGIIVYCACRVVSINAPSRPAAFYGALCCIISYELFFMVLRALVIKEGKYTFLYGTLGSLVILLVQVYFFFVFFFFSAQLTWVIDSFDALLFSRFRQARMKQNAALAGKNRARRFFPDPVQALFFSVEGQLEKYKCVYRKGQTIFRKGDSGNDIYYLFEGEVDVFLPAGKDREEPVNTLKAGSFFGEMGHLLSGDRSATVKARTPVSAIALPPKLFDEVLKNDSGMDRAIIEHLSHRLKIRNEQLGAAGE